MIQIPKINRNKSKTVNRKLYVDKTGAQKVTLMRDERRKSGDQFTITESADGLKVIIEFKEKSFTNQ